MRPRTYTTLLAAIGVTSANAAPDACTFYGPRFSAGSFGNGSPRNGCADFSAERGRAGCTKVKGVCPACVTYPGDHLQMWLPDYYVEVTRHTGESVFAQGLATIGLKRSLASIPLRDKTHASRGASSPDSESSFWNVRVLQIPFGEYVGNYPPVGGPVSKGFPICFSALSELLSVQWNFNLVDAPAALAWAPVGLPLCLSAAGQVSMEALQHAKALVSDWAGTSGGAANLPADLSCARTIAYPEARAKAALPGSAALAPFSSSPDRSLCMGSWGNLLPRTGTATTTDELHGALSAAWKFLSLAADLHLNGNLSVKDNDKWQLVWPPAAATGRCFLPGSVTSAPALAAISAPERLGSDLTPFSKEADGTFVFAIWRKRTSCQEPLETFGTWSADYALNFAKNKAACAAFKGVR